jgi:soluble lytic murein transglycosylase-like protein
LGHAYFLLRKKIFRDWSMKLKVFAAALAMVLLLIAPRSSMAQRAQYEALVTTHAKANGVPESLVHRIIVRESRYQAQLLGRGGTIGLMQIKLGTARGLGYTGTAEGLRDPDTNLKYAVKYLAGAYRAAKGDLNRAVADYAGGSYYIAKQQRLAHQDTPVVAKAAAPDTASEAAKEADAAPTDSTPTQADAEPVAKP